MNLPSAALEIEVKFLLVDPARMRHKLLECGAQSDGRVFERNIRFEDAQQSLQQRHALLRLRHDKRTRLTFKSEVNDHDPDFKIHREWEVDISDFDTMRSILEALGYHSAQIYEKWRETWRLGQAELCLDEMPFGSFLEIEGPRDAIRPAAQMLDLPWEQRICETYLALFERVRRRLRLSFDDITFENFKTVEVDAAIFREASSARDSKPD